MKTIHIFGIAFLFIALMLALVFANINPSPVSAQTMAASLSLQTTPTPLAEGISEIGSTDGILLMGVIISVIVIVPMLLRKKSR